MKNMRISLVLIFSAFHFALPFKLNAQDFFKECIHFKVKDTSSKVLPDYDTSYSGIYPHLQYIIDSLEVLNISRPYKIIPETVFGKIYFLKFEDTSSGALNYVLNELRAKPWIEFATPIHLATNFDDGIYNQRAWHYDKVRFSDATEVLPDDSSNVVIAVIDDGFNLDHEDLAAMLYNNKLETNNGIDDDNNGYIDDVSGWDAADNDNDANLPNSYPSIYSKTGNTNHGSLVAGICSAEPNNGIGITGHSYGARLLPIKLKSNAHLDSRFITFSVPISQGLTYAAISDADIINLSLGYVDFYADVVDSLIIDYGYRQGKIWVAAVGNHNNEYPAGQYTYPSKLEQCIAVGAINSQLKKAASSNYGPRTRVDVFAPGNCIPTVESIADSKYSFGSGTSAAAPIVCGAIAQLKSINPNINADSVRLRFQKSSTNIDFINPAYSGALGSGLIDFYSFIRNDISHNVFAETDADRFTYCLNEEIGVHYNRPIGTKIQFICSSIKYGVIIDTLTSSTQLNFNLSNAGFFNIELIVKDSLNTDSTLFLRHFTNFLEVKSCDIGPVYRKFSNWYFGENAGLVFNDSGVRTLSNNNNNWVGHVSSYSDYSGKLTFNAGWVADTCNGFKIINNAMNQVAPPFTNFKYNVEDMDPTYSSYNGIAPIVNLKDTTNIHWLLFSDCLAPRDLSNTKPELLHVRADRFTNTISVDPVKIDGSNIGSSNSWVGNGIQVCRNKQGTGNFIMFFGDRRAYYAANKIYVAYIPDSVALKISIVDSVSLDVDPLDESLNYIKISNFGEYFFARQSGFERGSYLFFKTDQIVCRLNTETGKIEHKHTIKGNIIEAGAFSSNCNYFYGYEIEPRTFENMLYQFELEADSLSSPKLIYNGDAAFNGAVSMQNGPDDKIYISHDEQHFLHCIHLPEDRDSIGYDQRSAVKHNYIDLQVFNPYQSPNTANYNIRAYGGMPIHCFDSSEAETDKINYYYVGCDSIRFFNDGPKLQKWYFQGNEKWGNNVTFPVASICKSDLVVKSTFMGKWTTKFLAPQYPDISYVLNNCFSIDISLCIGKNTLYLDSTAVDSNKTTYNVSLNNPLPKKIKVSFCDTIIEKSIELPIFDLPNNVKIYPNQPTQFKMGMQPFWNLTSSTNSSPRAYFNGIEDSTAFTNDSLIADTAYFSFRKPGIYSIWFYSSCGDIEVKDIEVRYGCDSISKYDFVWDNPYTTSGATSLSNAAYLVRGNWSVSNLASLNVNNCIFVFDSCSNWNIGDNTVLNIVNSSFSSCKIWAGLNSLNPGSQTIISSSYWSFATNAVSISQGKLAATYNTFGANEKDIKVTNTTFSTYPLLQFNKFNNSKLKVNRSCSGEDTSFASLTGHRYSILLRNTDGAKIAGNEFIQNRPHKHNATNIYLQNSDSILVQGNNFRGNNFVNLKGYNINRLYIRENDFIKDNTFPHSYYSLDTLFGSFCILNTVSTGRIYDNSLENSETGIEFYSPTQIVYTDIRNNVFLGNKFGILAASHAKPTDTGSSNYNNISDSVYLKVFCNNFTNHYLAFGGVGVFPIFEGKKQTPNYMGTYKAANYFYNCDNAFFIRSEYNIKYNYDFNSAIEEPTANNMQIAGNLYINDTFYIDLTDKSVNKIDTVNVILEFCGSGMKPFQLSNHTVNDIVFAHLMPNPVRDYLYVNTNLNTGDIFVQNIAGQLIDVFKVHSGQNILNLSGYPSGIYIFTLKNPYKKIVLGKVVISNE